MTLSRSIVASSRVAQRRFAPASRCFSSRAGQHVARASSASVGSSASQQQNGGRSSYRNMLPVALVSLAVGFAAGNASASGSSDGRQLPSGLPRTCCEDIELTDEQIHLYQKLTKIAGKTNVLDGREQTSETSKYLKGSRLGSGSALYIVKPTKISHIVNSVKESIDAGCVVLVQGQNTGLTGGSVPRQQADGRPTVIISTQNLDTIFPIDKGERVVCLPGAGLAQLQNFMSENFPHRESHSTLGSTFLNPTAAAGIAFGSGGTQCRKGPAFTDRALYLKVDIDKFGGHKVKLVNTLGIKGFDKYEGETLANTDFDSDVTKLDTYAMVAKGEHDNRMKRSNDGPYGKAPASDVNYKSKLCKKSHEVNRCNADTSGCDCNRSEGKVIILASVHDTFEKPKESKSFWISFDSLETALKFRTEVCLDNPHDMPVSVEYMDRDSFDVIDESGRILGNLIKAVGTASPVVRTMWNFKLKVEAMGFPLLADKVMFFLNPIMPAVLPAKFMKTGKEYDHHIAMTAGDFDGSLEPFLQRLESFTKSHEGSIVVQECDSASDVNSLTAFRFIAAPAFRTWCVGKGLNGFSVDYALPCDGGDVPALPQEFQPVKRMRYSHFGCNVVHEDLAFDLNVDTHGAKKALKKNVEHVSHGKLPAEHGHGTEYVAPPETQARWKKMDPLNVMNPGVGGLSTKARYKE